MSRSLVALDSVPRRSSRAVQLAPQIQRLVGAVLLFNLLWLPVEDAVLALLSLPAPLVAVARLGSEASLYLAVLVVVAARLTGGSWRRTPVDLLLVVFLASTLGSVLLFDADPLAGVLSLRTFLRYTTAFFLVVQLDYDQRRTGRYLRLIALIGAFEGLLALAQRLVGAPLTTMFLPRSSELVLLGQTRSFNAVNEGGIKVGAVLGTFTSPAGLASFLLLALAVALGFAFTGGRARRQLRNLLFAALALLGIFLTLKRSALLVAAAAPLLVLWLLRRRLGLGLLLPTYALAAIALGALALDFLRSDFELTRQKDARRQEVELRNYFATVLSPQFWQRISNTSRLWFILEGGGFLIDPSRPRNWLGYGPDDLQARAAVIEADPDLARLERYTASRDVFWVTLLLQYGLVVLVVFLLVLIRLLRQALWLGRHAAGATRVLAVAFAAVLLLGFVYAFAERIFLLRTFAFPFWLLAGLVHRASGLERARRRAR